MSLFALGLAIALAVMTSGYAAEPPAQEDLKTLEARLASIQDQQKIAESEARRSVVMAELADLLMVTARRQHDDLAAAEKILQVQINELKQRQQPAPAAPPQGAGK